MIAYLKMCFKKLDPDTDELVWNTDTMVSVGLVIMWSAVAIGAVIIL